MAEKFQRQRFEHKYIIRPEVALAVRDFVSSYLEIDEFGFTQPNYSYPVHSLYLDSDDLKLYHSTINGDKNRYKLRVRFYEDRPNAPVYFEIKRRMNNTISKERGGVRREAVEAVLAGQIPEISSLVSSDPMHLLGIQNFIHLMQSIQAKPKAHVAYLREAWVSSEGNSVRVTMDRNVRCDAEPTSKMTAQMRKPSYPFGEKVVLELKFTDRYPGWFRELVEVFSLMQCGAAKYVDGLTVLGTYNVTRTFVLEDSVVAMKSDDKVLKTIAR